MTKPQGIAADGPIVLDEETKQKFLELKRADPRTAGDVRRMRELGVRGTRRQIKDAIAEQLGDEIADLRADLVRDEIIHRALNGYQEPVYYQGVEVGTRLVKNPRDTELAARCWVPEAKDHLELTGAGGGPIEIEGRAVVGLGDVLALARELGISPPGGLDAGAARPALPAASDVLPDPPAR